MSVALPVDKSSVAAFTHVYRGSKANEISSVSISDLS